MRNRARPARSNPLAMGLERGLDLGFLDRLGRGVPFQRCQPPVLIDWNHNGRFASEVNYLVLVPATLVRVSGLGRLWSHGSTVAASTDI